MFRIALVGCGSIAEAWVGPLLERGDVEVVALVDVVEERARALAEAHGLASPTFAAYDEALAAVEPEVVVNLTTPQHHHEVVLEALERGCHVLGEKPMAVSLEQAKELIAAAERAERTYAVMQNRRFQAGIRTMRERIVEGRIGAPTLVSADFFLGPHFGGFREEMESPLLVDMAIHTFDEARFLIGADAISVYCHEFSPDCSWYRGRAAALCIFEMSDGSVFSYQGAWCAVGFPTSWNAAWRVTGTLGTAVWDGEGNPRAEVALDLPESQLLRNVEPDEWQPGLTNREGHAGCIDEMLASLAANRPPETDCHDNVKSLAMVFAALESAREGRRVLLEELTSNPETRACSP